MGAGSVRDDVGWFENQIEERRRADQQMLEDSFVRAAGVVMGARSARKIGDERIITKTAIDEILKYYHFKGADIPESLITVEDQLDYCLRPYGMMRRKVDLTEGWYKDGYGPVLAFWAETGDPVALLPASFSGYFYKEPVTDKHIKIDGRTAGLFEREGICFYRPLPQKKLGIGDLLVYIKNCLSLGDLALLAAATLAVTLVAMLLPEITKILTGPVLASGRTEALTGIGICLVCIAISSQLLASIRGLLQTRINTKTSMGVQASMMMRIMSLPASFFDRYSPGELRSRSMAVNQLCSMMVNTILAAGLTTVSSLLYFGQIFHFAPVLLLPALLILSLTVGFTIASTLVQVRLDRKKMDLVAKESGMSYALITGVEKIRLAGAEKRVFAKWLTLYADGAELSFNPPLFLKINGVISMAIGLFSNIILYYLAAANQVGQSSYFAFTVAYGALMGAFMSLSGTALTAAQIRPILEMAEPFLKTEPESSPDKEIVTRISGGIELDHVSFRYSKDGPYILQDLSLKIRPGEYVALTGRTGCGKSTLLRLLLGFEKPEKGAIYYDGRDLNGLDLSSLRRKIGTVLQDSGLFQGSIYSNIVITAPELGLDAAWEAADQAGIGDDIRAMPMGMHTVIGEGQGGISGGQRQRIMIARAIAPKPRLLFFDEATSALDNKTQRQVAESLQDMGCTRLVIAHRLSTIRHCDRILFLEDGRIKEEGTYDQLIDLAGSFARLVDRQRLDQEPKEQ